jgi:hypothetical protein
VRIGLPCGFALVALLLGGCAGLHPSAPGLLPRYEGGTGLLLQPGDLVVAVDRGNGTRHALVRVRRSRLADGSLRVHSQQLMSIGGSVLDVSASADGRWIAAAREHDGGPPRVELWDLRSRDLSGPAWRSPEGCSTPVIEPESRWLAVGCLGRGRQPAMILQVELRSSRELALVGERERVSPAIGVDGDLYWIEQDGHRTLVMRRPADRFPYVTHELLQPIRSLWPQDDGSLLAELALPGHRREFVRLGRDGVVRDEPVRQGFPRSLSRGTPLFATPQGTWFAPVCDRGPCAVLQAEGEGEGTLAVSLGGLPTAVSQVPWLDQALPHPEDLATAPASVLSSHPAAQVSVLGVELGTPLETAFSRLDRAGRHPYWIESRGPREKPRGIGLGWTTGGHCIEYLADERGVIVTVDLKACAGHYLSPPLQPLLDRDSLAEGPLAVARRYLGPGVAVTVGGGDGPTGERAPIRRTEVVYTAPERGYHFEAHTEVLATNRSRLLGGWVWLRLQLPGRRQAAASRPQ